MYSEITNRFLVGGWLQKKLLVDVLVNAEVTHLVNLRHEKLDPITCAQFRVLECEESDIDKFIPTMFWLRVFDFTVKAHRGKDNKLYFHVPASHHPESPVGCYAGLRALGYSAIQTRLKLEKIHPIQCWHEVSIRSVEVAYECWCAKTGRNPERVRAEFSEKLKKKMIVHDSPFKFSEKVSDTAVA